jgi:hypothetical protein
LALIASASTAAQSKPTPRNAADTKRGSDNQTPTQPPMNVTVTVPKPSPEETAREEKYRQREVVAAEDVRDFTGWLTFLTFIQAGIGFFGIWVAVRAANAAKASADAATAANNHIKLLNKQWVRTSGWTCHELPGPKPQLPTHLSLSFRVTNGTPLPLTLERVKYHVIGAETVTHWINAPLGPSEPYRLKDLAVIEFDRDRQIQHVQGGTQFRVVGCAYFVNAFGERDTTLFGRIIKQRDGKTRSWAYRGGLASNWQRAEEQETQTGKGQPKDQP